MQLSTWKFMSNMFAVVELKYSAKSYFVVRTDCIKNFNKKFGNTQEFLCFISPNKDEKPNFQADYKREYCGTPGLFKIFVVKTFDSLQAAMYDLGKKRLFSVPTKFRDPSHTDTEVLKDQEKERRKETNQNKKKMDVAKRTNMNYLFSEINSVAGATPKLMKTTKPLIQKTHSSSYTTVSLNSVTSRLKVESTAAGKPSQRMICDSPPISTEQQDQYEESDMKTTAAGKPSQRMICVSPPISTERQDQYEESDRETTERIHLQLQIDLTPLDVQII